MFLVVMNYCAENTSSIAQLIKAGRRVNIIKKKIAAMMKWLKRYREPSELFSRIYIDFDSLEKSRPSREGLVKTMEKGCRILEDIGVKYWIGRGSVLGFHRDGDFLPNDNDIDIDVLADRDIYEIIRKMPFDILYVTSSGGHYMQFAFLDRETDVIFDLWFYHEKEGKLMNRNHYGYFWLPTEKIQNLTTFHFHGRDYPSPEPAWFCEFWYGKDWMIPKKYGKDWSIDYRRDCKGFIYTGEKNLVYNNYFQETSKIR